MHGLSDDPVDYLRQLGEVGDRPLDVAFAALTLSSLDHLGHDLAPYRAHLAEIAEYARSEAGLPMGAEDGARALSGILVGRYGYDGDRMSYDDLQNGDFIAVIDRRRGLPVALGILYLHAARAAGFEATGLRSPGHFLLRIALNGQEALIDPFHGGAAVERETLGGPPSLNTSSLEDDGTAFDPVGDIDVLLRLQNNLKTRALQTGERSRAIEIAKRMALIAPSRPELWMDLAHLHESAGALGAAQKAYEACLALAEPGAPPHNEAALGLFSLKRRLN